MSRKKLGLCILVGLFTFLLTSPGSGQAGSELRQGKSVTSRAGSAPRGGPAFAGGQVVVVGSPADITTDYQVIKYLPYANLSVVAVEKGKEWGQVRKFRSQGRRAGLNYLAQAFAAPNDPYYHYQWHMPAIQSEQAWDLTDGAGVIVAVLDTGLATLPQPDDGIDCVVSPIDIVNNDNDPADGDGHGTHVTGTIAQSTGNGVGAAGMANQACIMPVKVLDDNGSGSFADIAEGVYYAVDSGAAVINMSLGINARLKIKNDPIMDPALEYAFANDVSVICASGNDGSKSNVSYPAIYPTTIAVGATDFANNVPRYSNKGAGLDLVAPGGNLDKDLNGDGFGDGVLQETFIGGEWGYWFFDGTSMAAPHVSAVAAMLVAAGKATAPSEIYSLLTSTAKDLGKTGYDPTSGYGLVQAYDALQGFPVCADVDNDGWDTCGGDCNDSNSNINPGAIEICNDELDNNCDGTVDEGCGGTCIDMDGDGWCVEDGDCNDQNPVVYPGHPDKGGRWGRDGLDNDCNGIIDG